MCALAAMMGLDRRSDRHPFRGVALLSLAGALLLAGRSTTRAGVNVWTGGGTPEGEYGRITALAMDPTKPATVYAGTDTAGIFKSVDGGAHWTAINTGFAAAEVIMPAVTTLAIDPAMPSTVYAVTDIGLFKSIDSGASWEVTSRGLTGPSPIGAFVVDAHTPGTVYAATDYTAFRSTDGGADWEAIYHFLDPPTSSFDPSLGRVVLTTALASPGVLYVGTSILHCIDTHCRGGPSGPQCICEHASPSSAISIVSAEGTVTHPLPSVGFDDGLGALAIDPATPTTIYAGTDFGAVLKSTDAGGDWVAVGTTGSSSSILVLAIDPAIPETIYAGTHDGVLRSADGGASWTTLGTNPPSFVFALWITTAAGTTTVYAGTGSGLFDLEFAVSSTTTTIPCTSARCTLDAALGSPLCAGQPVPASVRRRFDRAANLSDQATRSSGKHARKLRKRTAKFLKNAETKASHAAKGKRPKISASCAAVLKAAAEAVAAGLGG
jgi:hypothetical protein